jgi:hypothetical protein
VDKILTDGPIFQRAEGNLTFREVGEMISGIWNNAFKDIPMYANGSATDDVVYPNVVWSCGGKWPMGQLKPRLMEEFLSNEGDMVRPIAKSRMKFRAILEITIFSRDAEQANQIVEEFEFFMYEFIGAVKKAGAAEILYAERAEDSIEPPNKPGVISRTLRYEVHEELAFVTSDRLIESIRTAVSATSTNNDMLVEEFNSTLQVGGS